MPHPFPQRCAGRLSTSLTFFTGELLARITLHSKNYFWKALGHFLTVNISVNTLFFYLYFFLLTAKTNYCTSLHNKARWKAIIMTYIWLINNPHHNKAKLCFRPLTNYHMTSTHPGSVPINDKRVSSLGTPAGGGKGHLIDFSVQNVTACGLMV